MKDIKMIVGRNLKQIRKTKNLTLQELSVVTGVSTSMLGDIERSITNPTITVLWKIASGLKIPFTDLIKEERPSIDIVRAEEINVTVKGEGFTISSIFPYDNEKKMEVYILNFLSGGRLVSKSHNKGVEEYIFVYEGEISITIDNEIISLKEGDSARYRADLPHEYYNSGDDLCKAYMIIYYMNN